MQIVTIVEDDNFCFNHFINQIKLIAHKSYDFDILLNGCISSQTGGFS